MDTSYGKRRDAADHDEVDNGRGRSGAKRRGVLEMAMADAAESDKRLPQ